MVEHVQGIQFCGMRFRFEIIFFMIAEKIINPFGAS